MSIYDQQLASGELHILPIEVILLDDDFEHWLSVVAITLRNRAHTISLHANQVFGYDPRTQHVTINYIQVDVGEDVAQADKPKRLAHLYVRRYPLAPKPSHSFPRRLVHSVILRPLPAVPLDELVSLPDFSEPAQ